VKGAPKGSTPVKKSSAISTPKATGIKTVPKPVVPTPKAAAAPAAKATPKATPKGKKKLQFFLFLAL
jgi:hypothetical protein